MEGCNEALKLIAQSIANLKEYVKAVAEHEVWEINGIEESIKLLESAIDKLAVEPK